MTRAPAARERRCRDCGALISIKQTGRPAERCPTCAPNYNKERHRKNSAAHFQRVKHDVIAYAARKARVNEQRRERQRDARH
jgi:hypothetical protein